MNTTNENLSVQQQDQKTRDQVEAITEEIKASQRLTSHLIPIRELSDSFARLNDEDAKDSGGDGDGDGDNPSLQSGFRRGCEYLESQYSSYRAVRGDGNCYYRAFLYALSEHLFRHATTTTTTTTKTSNHKSELHRIQEYVTQSIEQVVLCGYDRFAVETFHEEMIDLLTQIENLIDAHTNNDDTNNHSKTDIDAFQTIHNLLNEENSTSDYCTWYLRVITSTYLQSDPNRFIHFLDDDHDHHPYTHNIHSDPNKDKAAVEMATYCSRHIDPMGTECSMVGVLALAEAFGVQVDIEYMDGRDLVNGKLVKHSFGVVNDDGSHDDRENEDRGRDSSSQLGIALLYRPGHYDILYK